MTLRKKKIFLIQLLLLFAGLFLLIVTYINFEKTSSNKIFTREIKSEIDKKIKSDVSSKNTFYDIEYSGIDLSGNRYILRAKEAVNDQTVEGLRCTDVPAFSVQYHPESSPGPHDSRYLFEQFIDMIEESMRHDVIEINKHA